MSSSVLWFQRGRLLFILTLSAWYQHQSCSPDVKEDTVLQPDGDRGRAVQQGDMDIPPGGVWGGGAGCGGKKGTVRESHDTCSNLILQRLYVKNSFTSGLFNSDS